MNHLNDCFHHWHCASGSCKQYLVPCSNGIPLQDFNQFYLWISNKVIYSDREHGSLAIDQGQVYMHHKYSQGKFKVPFTFNGCLDDQFRSASFNLHQLKLWILFTTHTSMASDKWEWKTDHLLIKSTQYSLPSPRRPSTIVCLPGQQAMLGSHRSLVQEVEHNVSATQETLIIRLIMNAEMHFVFSMRIFVLPRQRFKPKR